MFKAWGDSPGTTMKPVIEPSLHLWQFFARVISSAVLPFDCLFICFKKERLVHTASVL